MYNATLSITVPDTLKDIAAKIGKALDPDAGGEYSFTARGDGTINVTTPCEQQFKEQALVMMQYPTVLYEKVLEQYTTRWAELTPPTLAECELFCASIIQEVTA